LARSTSSLCCNRRCAFALRKQSSERLDTCWKTSCAKAARRARFQHGSQRLCPVGAGRGTPRLHSAQARRQPAIT
jgi:hypothetical protein